MAPWQLWSLGILLVCICASDVRSLRIPNALTFPGIALALGGSHFASLAVLGAVVGLVLFAGVSAVWPFAPGDTKLAAMIGAFTGPTIVAIAIATSLLLFAVYCWLERGYPEHELAFTPFLLGGVLVACGALG